MPLSPIITGVTGMVGEGVLHEALMCPDVERVLVVTRRPSGVAHPKLTEIVHNDFYALSAIESRLAGYNACFFCLGVTSVGKKEEEYRRLTYDLTMTFGRTLSRLDPGMTFCYISGKGTDSTERGRSMWARIKGKTENDLMKLPFKHVFAFRPGYIHPTPGMKNTLPLVKYFSWLYPMLRQFFPDSACTLREIGLAMIHVSERGYPKSVIEVKDIVEAAK